MTALFALSLQQKIEQYGAYAGIAAVVGLGVLALLYFAQAREVKRLREWAGRAPERAAELEARVSAQAQNRVTAVPVARPTTPAAAPAAGSVVPAVAAPAASVATPATAAAARTPTPAGPLPGPAAPGAPAATPAVAAAGPATAAPGQAALTNGTADAAAVTPDAKPGEAPPLAASAPGAPAQPASPRPGAPATPPGPLVPGGPVTPASAPASPAQGRPAVPGAIQPTTAATPVGSPAESAPVPRPGAAAASPATGPRVPPRPAQPLRAPIPQATVPPRTPAGATRTRRASGDGGGHSRARLVAPIAGGVVLLGVLVVLLVTQVFGGEDPANTRPNSVEPTAASNDEGQSGQAAAPKVDRSKITVTVLNGTSVTGFAREALNSLREKGFVEGGVTNDTTARQKTVVFFAPGNRAAALDVARAIKVGPAAVAPLDDATRPLDQANAQVVVSVGADLVQ